MSPSISSDMGKHHPRLKEIRKAVRRGELTDDGLLVVEGPHLIDAARSAGLQVVELFVREGEDCPFSTSRTHRISSAAFQSIGATRSPQGVLALVRPPSLTLEALLSRGPGVWIVLCGLQDPGNAGSLLRLGDAFGAAGCIRSPGTVGFYNDKLVRASAGSVFQLPWTSIDDLGRAARTMRSQGISILGTAADGAYPVEEWTWTRPTAVLFGREGSGLTPIERKLCDMILRIPHSPRVDSLNVASAGAILLYEAARSRRRALKDER